MMIELRGVFLRFCTVGVVGFVVDAGMTLLLTQVVQLSPFKARIIAFLIAATGTWMMNRHFTFRSPVGTGSWAPYVFATSIGALINVSVYWTWLSFTQKGPIFIVTGVALGSIAALSFNFFASRAILAPRRVLPRD